MVVGTIVTIANKGDFYLAAETIQNDIKYFLANKLTEDEEMTLESKILREEVDGQKFFLREVTDQKMFNFLAAVFTSDLVDAVEKIDDETSTELNDIEEE